MRRYLRCHGVFAVAYGLGGRIDWLQSSPSQSIPQLTLLSIRLSQAVFLGTKHPLVTSSMFLSGPAHTTIMTKTQTAV